MAAPFLVFSRVTDALAAPAPMALHPDTESKVSTIRVVSAAATQTEMARSRAVRMAWKTSCFIERLERGVGDGWH
jgi:hypothetical protein